MMTISTIKITKYKSDNDDDNNDNNNQKEK